MIELDSEAIDNIVVGSLKKDYIMAKTSIVAMTKKLEERGEVDFKLYSDISEERNLMNAIERILRERMPCKEYLKFMKRNVL